VGGKRLIFAKKGREGGSIKGRSKRSSEIRKSEGINMGGDSQIMEQLVKRGERGRDGAARAITLRRHMAEREGGDLL